MIGNLKKRLSNAVSRIFHPERGERIRMEIELSEEHIRIDRELQHVTICFGAVKKLASTWRNNSRTGELDELQNVRIHQTFQYLILFITSLCIFVSSFM